MCCSMKTASRSKISTSALGEDVESKFDTAYTIEAYIENTEGFEGEGNLLSKFGMELRDEATFIISRRQWDKYVGFYDYNGPKRPAEGDLIYLPLSRSFFEIAFVEHEQPFYQLNNLVVYKLQCRMFEYNEEDFSTGIEDIDNIEKEHAYSQTLRVDEFIGVFEVGDEVQQIVRFNEDGTNVILTARIVSYDGSLMRIVDMRTSDGIYREPIVGTRIQNSDDTASANVVEVYGLESSEDQTFASDLAANNYVFESEADSIIDFSENNPFGEPGVVVPASQVVTVVTMDDDTLTMDNSTTTFDNG